MSKTVDVSKLEKFSWWQLKHHSMAKKPVFTCTIQNLDDKSTYHSATKAEPQAAIDRAFEQAEGLDDDDVKN